MNNTKFRCLIASFTFPFFCAHADLTIDFDDGSNPFSAGTVSIDHSVSGPNSLFVGPEELPTYNLPPELLNKDLTITMMVFDQGKWVDSSDAYGPRWGVGHSYAATDYVAGTIINKGFLPSNAGYGSHLTSQGDPFNGQFSANVWFGPAFVSGSSRQGLSATGNDDSTGVGGWTQWSFDVTSDGVVSWALVGKTAIDDNIGSAVTSIFLFGGDTNSNLSGVYIDNIVITDNTVPEPSTYALAAGLLVIGACWLRRRR